MCIEATGSAAQRALVERDSLVALAYTDALTGLPNRRGLNERLVLALAERPADKLLTCSCSTWTASRPSTTGSTTTRATSADARRTAPARPLPFQRRGRPSPRRRVVVMAPGITADADAQHLGEKVLEAFDVNGQACRVGMTIGYALAPHDAIEPSALIQRADGSMYEGKQAGRHTLRRAGACPVRS